MAEFAVQGTVNTPKALTDGEAKLMDIKALRHPWVQGHEIYHWPEFIALCKRLGLEWENPTKDLNIFIPHEGSVIITQEYLGMDTTVMKKPKVTPATVEAVKLENCSKLSKELDKQMEEFDADKPTIVVAKRKLEDEPLTDH